MYKDMWCALNHYDNVSVKYSGQSFEYVLYVLITCEKNYKNEIKPSATTDTDGVYQLSSKQLLT